MTRKQDIDRLLNSGDRESEFKIESHIPPPAEIPRHIWPFAAMEVGESFAIKNVDLAKARGAAHVWSNKLNRTFTIRKYGAGHRCWRMK